MHGSARAPLRTDTQAWAHTGKLIVSRLLEEQPGHQPPGQPQPPPYLASVVLPDDLDALQKRVATLEQRPLPVGRSYMIAATENVDLPANRVMSTITGWHLSTDGGLQGIQIADAGFLIQPGSAYLLLLSDYIVGPLNQTGLRFQLQRSAIYQGEFDRPLMRASPSSYQTMWPYLADMYPNDILVVNAANTSASGFTLQAMRAMWVELAR